MRLVIVALLLGLAGCLPQPTQPECARFRDCVSCATNWCGWCDSSTGVDKVGCYSLREPRYCGPATLYVPYCSADPTDPGIYQMRRTDGGAR